MTAPYGSPPCTCAHVAARGDLYGSPPCTCTHMACVLCTAARHVHVHISHACSWRACRHDAMLGMHLSTRDDVCAAARLPSAYARMNEYRVGREASLRSLSIERLSVRRCAEGIIASHREEVCRRHHRVSLRRMGTCAEGIPHYACALTSRGRDALMYGPYDWRPRHVVTAVRVAASPHGSQLHGLAGLCDNT